LGEEDGAITTPIKPIRILRMPPTTGHLAHSSEHPATTALLAPAAALLLCIAVLITVIGQYTDLDLILADLYFDQNKKAFPWNSSWFARDFMHGWVKNVLRWVGFAILALTLLDLLRPLEKLSALRRAQMRVLATAHGMSTASAAATHSCGCSTGYRMAGMPAIASRPATRALRCGYVPWRYSGSPTRRARLRSPLSAAVASDSFSAGYNRCAANTS
jgi:hypothetical protein